MESRYKNEKIIRNFHLQFNGLPDVIFPLLCPEREKEWIPGWAYEMIYSKSGLIEEGCVFRTHEYDVETIWLVAKYDPISHRIFFLQFAKDLLVAEFSVALSEKEAGKTMAFVQYHFTPLNERGTEYINKVLSQKSLGKEMVMMEVVMNHYLDKGEILKI